MTEKKEPSNPEPSAGNVDGKATFESLLEALAKRVWDRAAIIHAEGRSFSDAELHSTLGTLCDRARENGLVVEKLLVKLKHAWNAAPASLEPVEKTEVITRLVSLCIIEYYRDETGGGGRR